jgi:hypothetical protein
MANIPANAYAVSISGSGTLTGSYVGFTALQATTFTALKDANGNLLTAAGALTVAAGATVPLLVTSASISSGAALFYL